VPNDIRKTQCDQLLAQLTAAAERGEEVGLPEILSLRIAQYGTRLKELRGEGHIIHNRTERRDGRVLSWYRLVSKPATSQPQNTLRNTRQSQTSPTETASLFGDLSPDRSYAE
jgi:hypothetical protein